MTAHDRRLRALALARAIEARERCPVMSQESIDRIDAELANYAIALLVEVRMLIAVETLESRAKTKILDAIQAAIQGETA